MYELGHSYGFRVHTEAEGYPYPFAELSGRWRVDEHKDGSEFDIETVTLLKDNIVSNLLSPSMAVPKFKTILIDLADAWADRMERKAGL